MLIEGIKGPDDLKALSVEELRALANELRELIIKRVSINGGHLSSNLGVVELAIALHYTFNSPEDKIIWDVGHQSYPHKLLTGRYNEFHTLRMYGGISGFPRITESPHDAFGTGHSSTSISAATGIIVARDILKRINVTMQRPDLAVSKEVPKKVIAVIGDGAMTAGLAFEGLNHAGHLRKDLIVILNDNEMSISPNVGALSSYLSRVLSSTFYKRFKRETKAFLEGIPRIGPSVAKIAQKAEGSMKGFFLPGGLFEDLGFDYIGPIDGHDIELLIETLKNVKNAIEPTLVHVVTTKGKGYKFSEEDPCIYHGVGPFVISRGIQNLKPLSESPDNIDREGMELSFSESLGLILIELAKMDERIVAITAAMKEGTGLNTFAERYPDRFFDVGIAEQHAVTFAAGLASQGLRPVVAIYSTFLQRAYDAIIHDVCLQNLPVIFAIDRAGIVGEDGATHHGLFDISYLRHIPNLMFMAPKDADELKAMLHLALSYNGPSAIRYPRAKTLYSGKDTIIKPGKAEVLMEGHDMAIIGVGHTVYPAIKAAAKLRNEGIKPSVINARFIKPLDMEMITSLAEVTGGIVTVEENVLAGGFGSAILELLNRAGLKNVIVRMIGIDDIFLEHGPQSVLRKVHGIDEDGIYNVCRSIISKTCGISGK